MDAHQIVNTTMARGEAERLARITGKSPDLFNSYGRPPRTPENPFGTGNYSPVYYYLLYCEWRKATNADGLLRMHRLVTAEVEENLIEVVPAASLKAFSMDILMRASEAVSKMNEKELKEASFPELRALDECLGRLHSALDLSRAFIRTELKRLEMSRVELEGVVS